MERLTVFDGQFWEHKGFPTVGEDTVDEFIDCVKELAERLAAIEDILGNEYDLARLRELVEADRDGRCVVFKFGMGSTVYRTWVRPDGSCPFVSAQLIETVEDLVHAEKWSNAYATREEAEQELRGIAENGT